MIERTEDWELIRAIATHPRAWKWIAADGLRPEDYRPLIHPRVHYLTDGDGFFCWKPMSLVAYEAHIVHTGPGAEAFAREACEWMLSRGALALLAIIPAYNFHAIRLAEMTGFKRKCSLTSYTVWRGRRRGAVVMEMIDG